MKKKISIVIIVVLLIIIILYAGVVIFNEEKIQVSIKNTTIENIYTNEINDINNIIENNIIEKNYIISSSNNTQKNKNFTESIVESKKETIQQKSEKKSTVTANKDESKSQTSNKENMQTNQKIKEKPEIVLKTDTKIAEQEKKEDDKKYARNDNMINVIKKVINENESENMKEYGYTIEVDSSIVEKTNQFTYTEKRVKDKITYKFGTIKIYAQDYYKNGELIYTECFIL